MFNVIKTNKTEDKIATTLVENKCDMDHEGLLSFCRESNSKYCIKGFHFDGVHCANKSCNKKFVDKIKGTTNCFKPTELKTIVLLF